MDFFRANILSIVTFWPLVGMFVLLLINKENKTLIRLWANIVIWAGFLLSLPLWFWFDFDKSDQMQFEVNLPWIQSLGANFHNPVPASFARLTKSMIGPSGIFSTACATMRADCRISSIRTIYRS